MMSRQILRNTTWKGKLMGINRQQQSRKTFHHFTSSHQGKGGSKIYRHLNYYISQKLAAISSKNIGKAVTSTPHSHEQGRTSAGTIHASPRHASTTVTRNHALLTQKGTRTNPWTILGTESSQINPKEGMRYFSVNNFDWKKYVEMNMSIAKKSDLNNINQRLKSEINSLVEDFSKKTLTSESEKMNEFVDKMKKEYKLDVDHSVTTLENCHSEFESWKKKFDEELIKVKKLNKQYRDNFRKGVIIITIIAFVMLTLGVVHVFKSIDGNSVNISNCSTNNSPHVDNNPSQTQPKPNVANDVSTKV